MLPAHRAATRAGRRAPPQPDVDGTIWTSGAPRDIGAPDFEQRDHTRARAVTAARPRPERCAGGREDGQAAPNGAVERRAPPRSRCRLRDCGEVAAASLGRLVVGYAQSTSAATIRADLPPGGMRESAAARAARPSTSRHDRLLVRLARRQVNGVDRSGLTEPMDTADALLDSQRAPRPLERDHQPGRVLEGSALRPRHRWSSSTRARPSRNAARRALAFGGVQRRRADTTTGVTGSSTVSTRVEGVAKLAEDNQRARRACRTQPPQAHALGPPGSGRRCQLSPALARVPARRRRRRSREPTAMAARCSPPRRVPPRAGAARRAWARSRAASGPRACGAGSAGPPAARTWRAGRARWPAAARPASRRAGASAELARIGQHRGCSSLFLARRPSRAGCACAWRPTKPHVAVRCAGTRSMRSTGGEPTPPRASRARYAAASPLCGVAEASTTHGTCRASRLTAAWRSVPGVA